MVELFINIWVQVRSFLETGGEVLTLIALVTFLLWSLIIYKFMYFRSEFKKVEHKVIKEWSLRDDKSSWFALRVRQKSISYIGQNLNSLIPWIKILVAICPLLGLMGTVTGMINVFDVMSVTGNSNTRLMASGISLATIPTMAGMVASLSGLYFENILNNKAKDLKDRLANKLKFES
jgi:biopolymer transport protein ExbB